MVNLLWGYPHEIAKRQNKDTDEGNTNQGLELLHMGSG
jgi:hypothetical protein